MTETKILSWIRGCVYVLIVGTPFFYVSETVYPTILSKAVFFEGVEEVVLGLWLMLLISNPYFRLRLKSPVVIGLGLFIGILTLTAFLGVDPLRSFWSTEERALGVFFWWHIAGLILAFSSLYKELDWQKIWGVSLATASVVVAIASLQLLIPGLILGELVTTRPGGTFGNPTFLAGYLLFHLLIALFLFLQVGHDKKQQWFQRKDFLTGGFLVCAFGMLQTQTRGDILGVLLGWFVFVFLLAVLTPEFLGKSFSRRRILGFLVLLFLGAGLFWTTRSQPAWDVVPGIQRFRTISSDSQELQPRFIAWKAALEGVGERPLLGWGWENFNIVFNKNYDPKALESGYQETRFDKPHNIFLEYLVSGGYFLLFAYILFFGAFIFEAMKTSGLLKVLVPSVVLAYFVRNFFVFETLGPVMMLALLVGYVHGVYEDQLRGGKGRAYRPQPVSGGVLALCLVLAGGLVIMNVRTVQAAYHQFWGFKGFVAHKSADAVHHFERSIEIWTPYRDDFKRDYAAAVADAYFYNPTSVPKEAVAESVRMMEEVAQAHPDNSYNHSLLVDIYNQVAEVNPEYLSRAEKEGAEALRLSPNRQQVLFSLAKTKSLENDLPGALALAKQGLALSPKVADGHFFYGVLAYASEDPKTGYVELKEAIRLGKTWRNSHEPLLVGNLFADSGHLDEAIGLYEQALKMDKDSAEVKIKLGVAYFLSGRRVEAKEKLAEVIGTVDLKASSGYAELLPILRELGLE